jgi:hypothetical protein
MVDWRAGLLRLPATILPIKDINKALSLALRRAGLLSDDTPKHEKIIPPQFPQGIHNKLIWRYREISSW